MRFFRIFSLHFENALEHRSRNFVWFLVELVNPMLYLLFWRGAIAQEQVPGFTLSDMATYYFLLIFAGAFLTVHIEEDVAYLDIKEGGLVKYLTKPVSYFWLKFFDEIPWRLIQGVFGLVVLLIFFTFYRNLLNLVFTPFDIMVAIFIGLLAYFLSFVFKMIIGLTALWIVDFGGLHQFVTVVFLIFAGFVVPISFLPSTMRIISNILPFSYMIYYPVRALQGQLTIPQIISVISTQLAWAMLLIIIYKLMWRKGIKKFTGIGQ